METKFKVGDKIISTWCKCILEITDKKRELYHTKIIKEGNMIDCKYSLGGEDRFTEMELLAQHEILTDMGKAIYED